jgi:hypothetical protein
MRASNEVGVHVVMPFAVQSPVQDTSTANISHTNNYGGAFCACKQHSSNAGITYVVTVTYPVRVTHSLLNRTWAKEQGLYRSTFGTSWGLDSDKYTGLRTA